MKAWTVRMPVELMDWLRVKAAKETIKLKKTVSMNALTVEILTKAMKADRERSA
ncbi:MAG: hypothetical protein OEU80_04690 [Deltaproteobacteria bacterium]|nr:hypothetical protein [Deltaproteobacteria bacterium]MDH3773210.1 hypothetical protein [Deltaproteobacteria bacterium]MDH3801364.1 hypothetical protein [Deltaproteobacteria bacterium]MDH3849760.1 hypothetical protein [Deltaproteobacteria bacterium]MDH3898217.1 hypothetical protein [Deltaproteobacteria bacterium]